MEVPNRVRAPQEIEIMKIWFFEENWFYGMHEVCPTVYQRKLYKILNFLPKRMFIFNNLNCIYNNLNAKSRYLLTVHTLFDNSILYNIHFICVILSLFSNTLLANLGLGQFGGVTGFSYFLLFLTPNPAGQSFTLI